MVVGELTGQEEFHARLRELNVLSKVFVAASLTMSEEEFFKIVDSFLTYVELDNPEKQVMKLEQRHPWLREQYPMTDRTFSEALLVVASGKMIVQHVKDQRHR